MLSPWGLFETHAYVMEYWTGKMHVRQVTFLQSPYKGPYNQNSKNRANIWLWRYTTYSLDVSTYFWALHFELYPETISHNTDFCETLISISKLRLSRKTLISFSISSLNFVVRTLILILNSHSQTLKNLRNLDYI